MKTMTVKLEFRTALLVSMALMLGMGHSVTGQSLPRDFALPTPLFANDSAWNQRVDTVAVLPDSDKQILSLYRILLGDNTTLVPAGTVFDHFPFPFMFVNHDEFSYPVFRMGSGQQTVLMRDYEGTLTENNPKLPVDANQQVTVPGPAGAIRPASPPGLDSDGHIVLYKPQTDLEYDFWQVTTAQDGQGNSLGAGLEGTTILEAGGIDFFNTNGPGANPDTYFSARAVGTPLLAGLLLPEDIEGGSIDHAFSCAIPGPRNTNLADPFTPFASDYFYPASTTETDFYNTDPNSLASGQRLRLKQTVVDTEGNAINEAEDLAPVTVMFLTALRTHGAIIVDNAGGFTFAAEEIVTAPMSLSDAEINALLGQPPTAPLPSGQTKWQILIEAINLDLEDIPVAIGPWQEGEDPATATITTSNFEVVEPAAFAGTEASNLADRWTLY